MFTSLITRVTVEIAIAGIVFWAVYLLFGHRHLIRPDLTFLLRRTGLVTDLCHWFANRVFFNPLWTLLVLLLIDPLPLDGAGWLGANLRPLPWALQLIFCLLVFDLAAYWRHRLMHSAVLWPVHAVHHSSTHLNWLSSIRNHPINVLVIYLFGAVFLGLIGLPKDLIAIAGTIRFYWVCFVHCDIRLDLGPLNYVIVTPDFHRWHHVSHGVRDKNFAGFFSLIDLVFGTFYLPRGRRAAGFGLGDETYPSDYLGQLRAPFRRLAAVGRPAS